MLRISFSALNILQQASIADKIYITFTVHPSIFTGVSKQAGVQKKYIPKHFTTLIGSVKNIKTKIHFKDELVKKYTKYIIYQ